MWSSGHVYTGRNDLKINFSVNGVGTRTLKYTETTNPAGPTWFNNMPITGTTGILVPMGGLVTKNAEIKRLHFKLYSVVLDNEDVDSRG